MSLNEGHLHTDVNWAATIDTGITTSRFHVTAIAAGDNAGERDGNRIIPRSIRLRGYLTKNPSATTETYITLCLVRVVKDMAGGNPSQTYIWENPVAHPWAYRNLDRVTEYQVLWRKYYLLNESRPGAKVRMNLRLAPIIVKYSGSAATNYTTGTLWLIAWANQSVNKPSMDAHCRFRYVR